MQDQSYNSFSRRTHHPTTQSVYWNDHDRFFVLFGLNITFNNLSVILQWYLDVTGHSKLTLRMLFHWNIMPWYTTLYSRLSLPRSPRDSLKNFEVSVLWHIWFAELRKKNKKIEQSHSTNEYVFWLLKFEIYWKYCGKEEKLLLRSNFSSFPQYFVTLC